MKLFDGRDWDFNYEMVTSENVASFASGPLGLLLHISCQARSFKPPQRAKSGRYRNPLHRQECPEQAFLGSIPFAFRLSSFAGTRLYSTLNFRACLATRLPAANLD